MGKSPGRQMQPRSKIKATSERLALLRSCALSSLCVLGLDGQGIALLWLPEWEEGLQLFLNLEIYNLDILQPQMTNDGSQLANMEC